MTPPELAPSDRAERLEIRSVEVFVVAIAHNARFQNWGISDAPTAKRDELYVIVKMTAENGLSGYGEVGRYYEGETPATIGRAIRDYLAPALTGVDASNIGAARRTMERALTGQPFAKSCVEMALFDLTGRCLNVPVWKLLGGSYRNQIAICPSVGINERPEEVCERVAEYHAAGYRDVKFKIGKDFARDRRSLELIRERVPLEMKIRVDPNRAYRPENALKILTEFEQFDLLFIEQPVDPGDTLTLRQLARSLRTPVFADEGTRTGEDVIRLASQEAARGIMVKPARIGGLQSARELGMVADATHLPVCVGSLREAGIATAALLHLAASLPRLDLACNLGGPALFLEGDVITSALTPENGMMPVPSGPGLGVDVDEDKLAFYAAKTA
jgi:muconate cycloisomerase